MENSITTNVVSKAEYDKLLGIFQDYVSNDAEAASQEYVRMALEGAGVNEDNAEKYGMAEYFEE